MLTCTKICILFLACTGILTITHAQNLVVNSSFEDYTTCPFFPSNIKESVNWCDVNASPDYFNACCVNGGFQDVPENVVGYQFAATGNAYAGFLCYGDFNPTFTPGVREYIAGTLSIPLVAGTMYYVSFKIALSEKCSHAIDHMGIKFTTYLPSQYSFPITHSAQVYTLNVITDTMNWTTISGSFISDSAYSYFVVGNHFDDSVTFAVQQHPVTFGYNAYYYLDDVCVSTDSVTCINTLPLPVELLFFKGEKKDGFVKLHWATASELNNSHFTIERADNNLQFLTIGSVTGAGTASEIHEYIFDDANPLNGINYYRLSQTDFDGKTTLKGIIAIKWKEDENLEVQFTDGNTLLIRADAGPFDVLIKDIKGVTIYKNTISSDSFEIPLNNFAQGLLIVSIITPGKVLNKKVLRW